MFRGRSRRVKENDGAAIYTRRWKITFASIFALFAGIICLVVVTTKSRRRQHGGGRGFRGGMLTWEELRGSSSLSIHERNILAANYFLIDIIVPESAVTDGLDESESSENADSVEGFFCPLDWHLQKHNPSAVPMFKELISSSKHCKANRIKVDNMAELARKARHYDQVQATKEVPVKTKSLDLSGVVFHETRCGSTLVANLLTGESSRVYSESPAPTKALKACEGLSNCNVEKHNQLVRDIFYLLGRTNLVQQEQQVFYKLGSNGALSLPVFTRVFPDTPWIFVYRDPPEVLASHFKMGPNQEKDDSTVCLRPRKDPKPILRKLIKKAGHDIDTLTNVEFCAAYLASLCQSVIQEHDRLEKALPSSSQGRFVNYADLPDTLWETIFPEHFGYNADADIDRLKEIATMYSKGKGRNADREWEDDRTAKQERANEEVRLAADTFMKSSFDRLQELSHAQ